MALCLKSNLIHCAVMDLETGETFYPCPRGKVPGNPPTYLNRHIICSDKQPEYQQYTLIRTLLEYFNPFRKRYSKSTKNCVTYVADFCGITPNGKRPIDVKAALSNLPGSTAGIGLCSECDGEPCT